MKCTYNHYFNPNFNKPLNERQTEHITNIVSLKTVKILKKSELELNIKTIKFYLNRSFSEPKK